MVPTIGMVFYYWYGSLSLVWFSSIGMTIFFWYCVVPFYFFAQFVMGLFYLFGIVPLIWFLSFIVPFIKFWKRGEKQLCSHSQFFVYISAADWSKQYNYLKKEFPIVYLSKGLCKRHSQYSSWCGGAPWGGDTCGACSMLSNISKYKPEIKKSPSCWRT